MIYGIIKDPSAAPCHFITINNVIRNKDYGGTTKEQHQQQQYHQYQAGNTAEAMEVANTVAINSLSSLRVAALPK